MTELDHQIWSSAILQKSTVGHFSHSGPGAFIFHPEPSRWTVYDQRELSGHGVATFMNRGRWTLQLEPLMDVLLPDGDIQIKLPYFMLADGVLS